MSKVIAASKVKPIAKTGLIAKGIVYVLLGVLAFMAAFDIGNQSANTGKKDVLSTIKEQTGGQIMLAVLALGLLCYSAWRFLQCFRDTEHKGSDAKAIAVRTRYFFSGLIISRLPSMHLKCCLQAAGEKIIIIKAWCRTYSANPLAIGCLVP